MYRPGKIDLLQARLGAEKLSCTEIESKPICRPNKRAAGRTVVAGRTYITSLTGLKIVDAS